MTDKEQIIIDGVDVSRCKFFNDITESYYCFGIPCKDRPNCYFKQLARKTQEFEELRSECSELFNAKLEILRDLDHYKRAYYGCSKRIEEHLVVRAPLPPPEFVDSRYRKALEEIEEYIYTDCEYNDGCDRNICIRCKYSNVHDKRILDIINKTKGEGDE